LGVEAETINYSGGGIYVGQVSNGTPNGQGSMTWTDGAKYVGDWKDGETHGQGTFTDGGGGKYVGGWKVGKCMVKEPLHTRMEGSTSVNLRADNLGKARYTTSSAM
jgi:hypothetical protein